MTKEEINNEENLEETEESEETSPETHDESEEEESDEEESTEEESEDIDYKKRLEEELDKDDKSEKSELEKAQRALFFNAQRVKELGGDPNTVLGKPKKVETEENVDLDTKLELKFAERDLRARAKNEDHFKLMMFYVKEKGLSPDDAYFLSNRGSIERRETEIKRADVQYQTTSSSHKGKSRQAPKLSAEEKALLERRGLKWNSKSQSYRGKYSETYYDHDEKKWKSRKL